MKFYVWLFIGLCLLCANTVYHNVFQPELANLSLEQLENPSLATDSIERAKSTINNIQALSLFAFFGLGAIMFRKEIKSIFIVLPLLFCTGCWTPYHEDVLVDIGTSEVAFLRKTVNDTKQADTAPEQALAADMINARRITVPYIWKQTRRKILPWNTYSNGKWIPAARLIVVNTAPEVREWSPTSEGHGIWVESSDSVGFSTGVNVTARIENRDDAVQFLSHYPPRAKREIATSESEPFIVEVTSLEYIIDKEVRTKIQEVFADAAASYTMDELRGKKVEILNEVRKAVIPYFAERGITITTIGQFGGFSYENPDIQKSIDKVFQAQQDEDVARAEAKAAEIRKDALRLVGEGEAQKAIEASKGRAEGVKLEANAEAEAVKMVADAKSYELQQLQANPEVYLTLKRLEVQTKQLERWNGEFPRMFTGDSNLLFNVPLE